MTPVVRLIWDAKCMLGEGPIWIAQEQALRFVDIKRGRLLRYHPATGVTATIAVAGKPSFIVPEQGGGLLVGSEHGIWRLANSALGTRVTEIDQPGHNRTNDATVDSAGRLWFGTMDDNEQLETGGIYCLERGELHKTGIAAVVTNGPAVTADARTLYHVDSVNRTIWRHDVVAGPCLANGEIFIQLGEQDGYPDGIVLDSEGCIWVALWGGWGVRRYSPEGELLIHVAIPCALVTKIVFGGADLRTVFVTTGSVGLDKAQLSDQPLAGGLFAFEVPVPGCLLESVRHS